MIILRMSRDVIYGALETPSGNIFAQNIQESIRISSRPHFLLRYCENPRNFLVIGCRHDGPIQKMNHVNAQSCLRRIIVNFYIWHDCVLIFLRS